MGDFNALINDNEKWGRLPIRAESREPFNNFLFNNGLIDLGYKGQRYTWNNFQQGDDNIKQLLDRAVSNIVWRTTFEKATLYHEPVIGSDHSPLRLDLIDKKKMVQHPSDSIANGSTIRTVQA
ncbi:hypothetical protein LINGRAHAP2_LOCUS27863 [Linum grandiflorum]